MVDLAEQRADTCMLIHRLPTSTGFDGIRATQVRVHTRLRNSSGAVLPLASTPIPEAQHRDTYHICGNLSSPQAVLRVRVFKEEDAFTRECAQRDAFSFIMQ